MSTTLYEGRFNIGSFYGGIDRGVCIQITDENGYVQLNRDDVIILISKLKEWNDELR